MAKLAKEATTMRRVLESLFRYFDSENLWSPEHGLALPVLKDMQILMDNSGIYNSTHLGFWGSLLLFLNINAVALPFNFIFTLMINSSCIFLLYLLQGKIHISCFPF